LEDFKECGSLEGGYSPGERIYDSAGTTCAKNIYHIHYSVLAPSVVVPDVFGTGIFY
jgi:hypothetical protein